MGLFDFLKKKRPAPDAQASADKIIESVNQIAESPPPDRISAEEYADIRQSERDWLEAHYDFSCLSGIHKIPLSASLPRPPGDSATGDVYYYLKYKARVYEAAGNVELAIACFRKSIALMRLKYGASYGREESYSFVRMLARNGFVEEAEKEKSAADQFYDVVSCREDLEHFERVRQDAKIFKTDLVIMSAHGSTCPECAKYQGRVYSLSGKSKQFPKLPDVYTQTGRLHKGCSHTLSAYIHGVNDPQLEYTLLVHPLTEKRYGKNIVTFSNRPFVDDRTEECRQQAEAVLAKRRDEAEQKKRRAETMIEREAEKAKTQQDYAWLQSQFPEKCPATISSYRRMRTQNTKNYQILKQLATEQGKEI